MSRDRIDESNLPPWLRGVPLPPRPPGRQSPPAAATGPAAGFTMGAPQTAPAEELPSWLQEPVASSEPSPAEQESLPDWLRTTPTNPAFDEPAPAAESGMSSADRQRAGGFTSWLTNIPDEPAPPARQSPPPTPPASTPTRTPSAEALPSWLTDMGDTPDTNESSQEQLPDWLRDMAPTGAQPEPPAASTPEARSPASSPAPFAEPEPIRFELPPEEPAPSQATPPAANDDSGIPDWLRSISDEEIRRVTEEEDEDDALGVAPFTFDAPAGAGTPPAQLDAPAWLTGDTPEERVENSATEWLGASASQLIRASNEPQEEPSAPAWLQDDSAKDRQDIDSGAPSWLQAADDTPNISQDPTLSYTNAEPAEGLPSWLRADAEPAPSSPPSEDLPSWLQADVSPAAPAQAEELPAWLQADAEPAPSSSAGEGLPSWLQADAPAAAPAQSEELPAWLHDSEASSPAAPAEDVPSWLRESEPPTTSSPSPEEIPAWMRSDANTAPPAPAEDIPAWLRDSEPPSAQPPAEDVPAWLQSGGTPATPESLPDWLKTEQQEQPVLEQPVWSRPDAAAPASTAPNTPDMLPPWLRDEAGEPLPTAGSPGDANLPAWLRGAEIESYPEPVAQPAAPVVPTRTPAAPAAAPNLDWFGDLETPATPAAGESGILGGADLPAWLRRETEAPKELSPADARSMDWFARLKAYDDDTAEVAEAAPVTKLVLPPLPVRTPAEMQALALLQQMVTNPFPETVSVPETRTLSLLERIGIERLLYAILLVLLIVTLAVPSLTNGLQAPAASPGAAALLEQVQSLDENDIVLIGYEWDAQRVSELRPLERAVINQLIAQRVKVVLVSTDPQGTLLQFDLHNQFEEADYGFGGVDYVFLGYRPGGEIALRSLAQDFRAALRSDFQGDDATNGVLATDLSTSQPRISTLNDFSMIMVLADEPTDIQGWMEQIRPAARERPMAFLIPAGVGPIAQPYLRQPGIYSVAGTEGALAYEQARDGAGSSQTALEVGQLRLSTLIFAGVLILSAIIAGVRRVASRQRQNA